MNDDHDDTTLDADLRTLMQAGEEPQDDGFSLSVMAALPTRVARRNLIWARWVAGVQWLGVGLAACGLVALFQGKDGALDTPHAMAAAALTGLLVLWCLPTRWARV